MRISGSSLTPLFSLFALTLPAHTLVAQEAATEAFDQLPDPDGKSADMRKKVKVFILMGQSNMLGAGLIGPADKPGTLTHAVQQEGLYPFLVEEDGSWPAFPTLSCAVAAC